MFNTLLRFTVNFLVSAVLILFFRSQNWIDFIAPPRILDDALFNDILIAGIIAFLLFTIGEILGALYKFVHVISCGFGCFVSVIYFIFSGYVKLYLASIILVNWFSFSLDPVHVIIISIMTGLIRWPSNEEIAQQQKDLQKIQNS